MGRDNLIRRESSKNKRGRQTSKSKFKGVSFIKEYNKWSATINLGQFNSDEEAAIAYDKLAHSLHREFAYINFPEKIVDPSTNIVPIILVLNDCYWIPYVLNSIEGWFKKIIIFDAGSTDGTLEILKKYKAVSKSDIYLEELPLVSPKAQLAYRNAPIAELEHDQNYILIDGDEIWPQESLQKLFEEYHKYYLSGKVYGVVNRVEVRENLMEAYSIDGYVPHHRIYNKCVTWRKSHPGEFPNPKYQQNNKNEYRFSSEVKVYHFHNTLRSPIENNVPKRIERKSKNTYHPGKLYPINIFERVPILKYSVENLPINPILKELQKVYTK